MVLKIWEYLTKLLGKCGSEVKLKPLNFLSLQLLSALTSKILKVYLSILVYLVGQINLI